jgi:nucleoside-diphosphate-sugar epimerase
MVDVREVASAHAALLEPGHRARRYMLGGPRVPIAGISDMLGAITGKRMGVLPVPDTALRLVGRLVDAVDRFIPFDTPVSEAAMEYYTRMPDTDDGPSERELGVKYRDSAETLADTVAGLKDAGRL